MPQGAHVTSTEAIEAFRASLLVYLSKARPILEDACDEVSRTRQWLQQEQRLHWENIRRRRVKQLEQAQQALYSATLANLREPTAAEQAAVSQAKRALNEAEEKLKLLKRWTLEFDGRVGPLLKQLEQLRTLLANDMPKAAVYLMQLLKALAAYAAASGGAPTAAPGNDGASSSGTARAAELNGDVPATEPTQTDIASTGLS
jgi:hypothetical protein